MTKRNRTLVTLLLGFAAAASLGGVSAAQEAESVNVLLVIAHPDDEAMFAATVYKITHKLQGNVDVAVVTDGSGGFRYAQLAEPIYGLELTDESIARQYLPAIRKRELMAGGQIIGIRKYFFLDQFDQAYTENIDTVITHIWDADRVKRRLLEIMARNSYDFVFVHLPIPNFHAHHKAASILALETASALPDSQRPVVLGSFVGSLADSTAFPPNTYSEHPGYSITRVRSDVPPFVFDRGEPLSEDGRLNYQIVVNWIIAEHKSQGTMQLLMNRGDLERFWYFAANPPGGLERARSLFEWLTPSALKSKADN
jgi:LmbE family N-acetylglucosaminyl deacetylase